MPTPVKHRRYELLDIDERTRRNGSTSDVFDKVTPVESIYLLLQNSRQTYDADYHDHVAQTDARGLIGSFSNATTA